MQRNLVSHAVNTHVRYVKPNLRMIRALVGSRTVAMLVCSKCLKRGRIRVAPSRRATRSERAAA